MTTKQLTHMIEHTAKSQSDPRVVISRSACRNTTLLVLSASFPMLATVERCLTVKSLHTLVFERSDQNYSKFRQ